MLVLTLLALAGSIMGYYWFLAVVSVISQWRSVQSCGASRHRFAIIIPAHNEALILAETLRSLKRLDYPSDRYQIYVVADNCTDGTARIAGDLMVSCLERNDPNNRGKGQALSWAFERLPPNGFDAVVVLDADSSIDSKALKVFDDYLGRGWTVLQASDVASNPDDSPMSYALAVGNVIENELFYAPKSRLGLAVFLRGTGFVVTCKTLADFPWRAHSIVEDIEYTTMLIQQGISIKFVPEVLVRSKFPATSRQLGIQRSRWAQGNIGFGKKRALSLIWNGVKTKNWPLADAGWTFLVLSKPLVLLVVLGAILAAICSPWLAPSSASGNIVIAGIILSILAVAYFALGVIRLGINHHRLLLLLKTPLVVIRLISISLKSLIGSESTEWVRTPRQG